MPIVGKQRIYYAMAAVVSTMGLLVAIDFTTARLAAKAYAQTASAGQKTSMVSAGITLHSVSVDLPASGQMFSGDTSAQAINSNCLGCHSADMILTQPPLSPSAWREEIAKMQTAYKAPVPEEDVPAIVDYLTSLKGSE